MLLPAIILLHFSSSYLSNNISNSKWGVWGNISTGIALIGINGTPLYDLLVGLPKFIKFGVAAFGLHEAKTNLFKFSAFLRAPITVESEKYQLNYIVNFLTMR